MYACAKLSAPDANGVQVCLSWVEQTTLNEMFGITAAQASSLAMAIALLLVTAAAFNRLSKLGG